MSSRLIRLLLVVLAVAIGVAAGYHLKRVETNLTGSRAATGVLRDQARAVLGTVSDVRAGQVAYLARGQGEEFWMSRVTRLLLTLDQQMADFESALASPAALEPVTAALENFHKLDARVREYLKDSDSLLASDLIFSDGLEIMSTAMTEIDAALRDELQARDARLASLRKQELMILGGGAGGVLLVLLVLSFAGGERSDPTSLPKADEISNETAPVPVSPDARTPPNLSTAAQLCGDLARVQEIRQLPALLERTAQVIDASGIIVWIADPSSHELRPAMSFGYTTQVMARIGSIPREATNAAAAAYRSAEMRIVNGNGSSNGALVVPLITPDGCIGVLSAEMKDGSEKNRSAQALASIFAAQLAMLVSPPPTAAVKTAAQA